MTRLQQKRKKKRNMLLATLAIAALIVGGLTFAWFTSSDSVINTFSTGTLKTVIVENFTSPTNWQPGVTTDKVVQVTNTGTIDAFTRVFFEPELSFDKKLVAELTTEDPSETTTEDYVLAEFELQSDGTSYGSPTVKTANYKDGTVNQAYVDDQNSIKYATVDAAAIDRAAANYDINVFGDSGYSADTVYKDGYFVQYGATDKAASKPTYPTDTSKQVFDVNNGTIPNNADKWKGITLPSNVVLYIKEAAGTDQIRYTVDPSTNKTVLISSGNNYDFMGYYVKETGATDPKNKAYYELKIEIDNSDCGIEEYKDSSDLIWSEDSYTTYYESSTENHTADGTNSYTELNTNVTDGTDSPKLLSKIRFYLYVVETYSSTAESDDANKGIKKLNNTTLETLKMGSIKTIDDVVDYNFYIPQGESKENYYPTKNDAVYVSPHWFYSVGQVSETDNTERTYYYYDTVLASGQTTTPLLESVTFNKDFTNNDGDISNIVFNLTVNELSSQAIFEAAASTFGPTDSVSNESNEVFVSDNSSTPTTYKCGTYDDGGDVGSTTTRSIKNYNTNKEASEAASELQITTSSS